jgi:hypothetical protein
MSKRKEQHFESVHIEYHTHSDKLFKIVVGTFYDHNTLAEFFLPREKNQSPANIDIAVVKYRLKKDFGFTFDHNSATYYNKLTGGTMWQW